MTPKKKVLVLTDHMPWGHRSIARAIFNYLKTNEKENGLEVEYAEVKSEIGKWGDFYAFLCCYLPSGNRIGHNLMKTKMVEDITKEITSKSIPRLKKVIENFDPDIIISSYYLHTHSLVKWRKLDNKEFKIWTVVADPRTTNPFSHIEEVDLHLVYDEVSKRQAIDSGIKGENILVTGWWVRPEMYEAKYQDLEFKKQIRNKLGFKDDRPIIFVGGGSLGNSALPKILFLLLSVKNKIGIIFNTGKDKVGFNLVEEYIKIFKNLKKDDLIQFKNLGWIDNMAEVLSASDIVFGKAGPNFLFDVVATGKPFVAVTHIGGQEDGNIDFILEKNLGWVKEKSSDLSKFFLNYIKNPKVYNIKYLKHINKEREFNRNSLAKVLERINNETE